MKIRTQIIALTMIILLLAMSVTVGLVVKAIRKHGRSEMEEYRKTEIVKVEAQLKDLVDAAYATVDCGYRNVHCTEFLEKYYARRLRDIIDVAGTIIANEMAAVKRGDVTRAQAEENAREAIRRIRYANNTGYLWINDTQAPFPTMIMHPTMPELEGQVLDDPKFNCAKGVKANLFHTMADLCAKQGEGMVDYVWPKPTDAGMIPDVPKVSYVRLFKEWGWIVGTGIYVDDAYAHALETSKLDVKRMRYDNKAGYFWINDMGRPIPKMIMHPTMPELDGNILDDPKFNCVKNTGQNLFQAMVDVCEADGAGVVHYLWPKPTPDGKLTEPLPKLSYVRLFKPLNWVIGTGVYVDSIDAAVLAKQHEMEKAINSLVLQIVLVSLAVAMAGALLCSVASRSLTEPIDKLVYTMEHIEDAGLQQQEVTPSGALEFQELAIIFNKMLAALRQAIDDLARTEAIKQRIESELRIAHDIQATILPKIIPPFPDRNEFQLHAILESAREVGGDFYDLFFIDDDHFCFVIGDVSDKGVPASLFMAVTKTLLKAAVLAGQTPEEAMSNVNRELTHDNDMCMFATVFLAVLEVSTGKVAYVNAGHCPPVLLDADGKTHYMESEKNIVIGVQDPAIYGPASFMFKPGSTIILYSDGITEAMNTHNQEFGEDRLLDVVKHLPSAPPHEILSRIHVEVKSFSKGAAQSDDITLLAVKYHGPS